MRAASASRHVHDFQRCADSSLQLGAGRTEMASTGSSIFMMCAMNQVDGITTRPPTMPPIAAAQGSKVEQPARMAHMAPLARFCKLLQAKLAGSSTAPSRT